VSADAAAREFGRPLSLSEALSLLLLSRVDPERYDRPAARWIGRYIGDGKRVTLLDVLVASAARAHLCRVLCWGYRQVMVPLSKRVALEGLEPWTSQNW
jgi:hypothetical protein